MGPTNVALVKLYQADQKLREAEGKLNAATKNVRVQERRVSDLTHRLTEAQNKLRTDQARATTLDLDLKSRDAHIEKLRTQQQAAKTNKEYQTFLIEINTLKVDKSKIEDETIALMELVEKQQGEIAGMTTQLEGERARLEAMRNEIGDRIKSLEEEIETVRPERNAAAEATPPKALAEFERLADRYDGEVLAAIERPHRKREEYSCTSCNMDLVTDIYNRLHTRDEIVYCPSCRRMLYIPEDLPIEAAVNKTKEKKVLAQKAPPARVNRQTSAVDVLNSMKPDPDEASPSQQAEPAMSEDMSPDAAEDVPKQSTSNTPAS